MPTDNNRAAELAEHFQQAEASLALEGIFLRDEQRAVMARVISGELDYDQALEEMARLARELDV